MCVLGFIGCSWMKTVDPRGSIANVYCWYTGWLNKCPTGPVAVSWQLMGIFKTKILKIYVCAKICLEDRFGIDWYGSCRLLFSFLLSLPTQEPKYNILPHLPSQSHLFSATHGCADCSYGWNSNNNILADLGRRSSSPPILTKPERPATYFKGFLFWCSVSLLLYCMTVCWLLTALGEDHTHLCIA